MKTLQYNIFKHLHSLTLLVPLVCGLLLSSQTVYAEQSFVDIGYSPANGSITQSIVFGVYGLKEKNSMYVNFSLGLAPGDSDYVNSNSYYGTASDFKQIPMSINIGSTFPIIPDGTKVPIYKSIHSYFGVGYASLSGIAKYSSGGYDYGYYNYTSNDKSGLNLNGGLIFMFNSFGINVGANSFTKSVYINIGAMIN
jgi:hypothetical protein